MTERGILFSAPMVRALLDGMKTQTRRPCKPMNQWVVQDCREVRVFDGVPHHFLKGATAPLEKLRCPYGQPGDRLWVRETWQGPLFGGDDIQAYEGDPESFNDPRYCQYRADGGPAPEFMTLDDELVCRWRPSIHMPRWASRILLEITCVRVERLQDISPRDARDEGLHRYQYDWRDSEFPLDDVAYEPFAGFGTRYSCASQAYRALWEHINGAGSWDANPWVWAMEFRRIDR